MESSSTSATEIYRGREGVSAHERNAAGAVASRPRTDVALGLCGHWCSSHKADPRALAIYERHYSARRYRDGRVRRQFCPPGETMVLLTAGCDALFVWVRNRVERFDRQVGVNCAVFRNEGAVLSSALVREASHLAQARWPGERLFTYVADAKIRSVNPGACFKYAGWKTCGRNADGRLTILELLPIKAPFA